MFIYVIGAPASGKGTLCKRWCQNNHFRHVSIGDHLRDLARDNRLDKDAANRIANCELLETEQLMEILEQLMHDLATDGGSNIMLDGFPRTEQQAKAAEDKFGTPSLVLYFDCPRPVALERYMTRSLAGRDTNPLVFEQRYAEFARLNAPIVDEYEQRGLLMKVDSSKKTHESYNNLLSALGAAKT